MNVGYDWAVGGEPPSYAGERAGYRGEIDPARVARTATVEGAPIPLYAMAGRDQAWPALADVRRLLNGASYRIIEVGAGLDTLRGPAGNIEVVSPQATAASINLALRDGRITAERAEAILAAIG